MSTRVLLLGDDPLTRSGAAALLSGEGLVEVVGQGALDQAPVLLAADPDVICWDPGPDGGEAERLLGAAEGRPVLALLGAGADGAALWRSGVRALLDRGVAGPTLAAGLHAAAAGLTVLDAALGEAFLRPPLPPDDGGPDGLTPREREVLALLAEGLGNKAIAARLGVSDHTAKFHVNAILAKLGAATRAEAIVLAVRRGLVAL